MGEDRLRRHANPELLRAIAKDTAAHSPETELAIWQALLQAELILPTWNDLDESGRPIGPAKPLWTGSQDGNILAVFTDLQSLERWQHKAKPTSFAVARSQGVFVAAQAVNASLVSINPDGPIGMVVGKPEIGVLAVGSVPRPRADGYLTLVRAREGEYVCLGPPRVPPPTEFLEQLREVLGRRQDVAKGFLFEASSGIGSQVAVGVVLTRGLNRPPDAEFIRDIQPVIANGMRLMGSSIDLVGLTGHLLDSVESQVSAFHERGG